LVPIVYKFEIEKAQTDEFTTVPGPRNALLTIFTAGVAALKYQQVLTQGIK
jgi:hypothetical protein